MVPMKGAGYRDGVLPDQVLSHLDQNGQAVLSFVVDENRCRTPNPVYHEQQ